MTDDRAQNTQPHTDSLDTEVDAELDVQGLNCPMPLLKAKQALNRLEAGALLRVLATDPGSVRDFEVFSQQSGNALLDSTTRGETYVYLLRKRPS